MDDIRMPIKFHGNYAIVIRCGDTQSRERCQKLTVRELSADEKSKYEGSADEGGTPTHHVTFYDFGCKRIIEGRLGENEEDRVVFKVQDKEYEFAPFKPVRKS